MPGQHLLVDQNRLAFPFFLGFRHFCHGADQEEIGIHLLQGLQSVHESCIFGPPIGIEKIQLVWETVSIRLPLNAEKGRNSKSACEEPGRLGPILV
jgi:hypothetical protein